MKITKIYVSCANCNKIKLISRSTWTWSKNHRFFCDKKCSVEAMRQPLEKRFGKEKADEIKKKISRPGELNPSFGRKWSEEKKRKQSIKVTEAMEQMGEQRRKELCGKSNRGKTRSKEFIDNWHSTQRENGYIHNKHKSEETISKIRTKSTEKWTVSYKAKHRNRMETLGVWLPRTEANDFKYYKKDAHWIERMWDIVPLPENFNLIGIFNCKENKSGYVRDHKLSKQDGYKLKLFVELLRHPVNCEIISHASNASKNYKSNMDVNTLLDLIESYTEQWSEQDICLHLVSLYRQGYRWSIIQ